MIAQKYVAAFQGLSSASVRQWPGYSFDEAGQAAAEVKAVNAFAT